MIVIVAALKAELDPLISFFDIKAKRPLGGGTLYRGENVSLLRVGVGQNKAAQVLKTYLPVNSCDLLINIGFAGSLDGRLNRSSCIHISEMISIDPDKPPILLEPIDHPSLKYGRLLTVNDAVLDSKTRRALYKKFGARLVDMEGYALAELCKKNNISFVSIKIISDFADENAVQDIKQQSTALARQLAETVRGYLRRRFHLK